MMIPFILCFGELILSAFFSVIRPTSQRSFQTWKQFFAQDGIHLLLLIVGTLYTFLVIASLGPFKCIEGENGYVLWDLPGVKCFDPVWISWLPAVVSFSIFYGLVLPAILIFLFWKNKDSVNSPSFQKSFGSFVQPFKPQFFWWGLIFVVKRTMFAISAAFMQMRSKESYSVFVTVLILCIFLWLEVRCMPYKQISNLYLSVA
jgi:hypothetical protein